MVWSKRHLFFYCVAHEKCMELWLHLVVLIHSAEILVHKPFVESMQWTITPCQPISLDSSIYRSWSSNLTQVPSRSSGMQDVRSSSRATREKDPSLSVHQLTRFLLLRQRGHCHTKSGIKSSLSFLVQTPNNEPGLYHRRRDKSLHLKEKVGNGRSSIKWRSPSRAPNTVLLCSLSFLPTFPFKAVVTVISSM